MNLTLDKTAPHASGHLETLAPGLRRLVAPNPGPFTYTGTCTYIIGRGEVAVLDPGPEDLVHIAGLLAGLGQERVVHILVSHTHRDHAPGARLLAERTGARILGCAPHHAARPAHPGEVALDAANDHLYAPDLLLQNGDKIEGEGYCLTALATPGHTMNHLAFAWAEGQALFSADHVMAWSTSIVAPPDGAMGAYMASLEALLGREEKVYWPGHGGPVLDPKRFVRGLVSHRRQRETQILDRLRQRPHTVPELVAQNYPGLDPRLKGAAALSTFAHLEDMVTRGLVLAEPMAQMDAVYFIA